MSDNEKLFEDMGLTISSATVEVGKVYPIYGMITNFISDNLDNVIVEINYNLQIKLSIDEPNKLKILKERAFEPGIFVTKIETIKPDITGSCTTVVFGKKKCEDVQ